MPNFISELKILITDLKNLNIDGYYHGDLLNNCRNIISYKNDDMEERKLQIQDVDSIKKFNYININIVDFSIFCNNFKEIICCLKHNEIITNEIYIELLQLLNIKIIDLYKSFKFDIYTIIDTTVYDRDSIYPEYTDVIFESNTWSDNTINGKYKNNGTNYERNLKIQLIINKDAYGDDNFKIEINTVEDEFGKYEINGEGEYDVINLNLSEYIENINNLIKLLFDTLLRKI